MGLATFNWHHNARIASIETPMFTHVPMLPSFALKGSMLHGA